MYSIKFCVSLVQLLCPKLSNRSFVRHSGSASPGIVPEEIYLDSISLQKEGVKSILSMTIPLGVQTTKLHHFFFEILITP